MKRLPLLLLAFGWMGAPAFAADAAPLQPGDTIFSLDLNDPAIRADLQKQGAEIVNEGPHGEPCLKITSDSAAGKVITVPFAIEKVRGDKICFLADMRGDTIHGLDPAVPLKSWEGGKFQTWYESAREGKKWTDESKLTGTFPWREVGRIVGVEDDATGGKLTLGLDKAAGTVWVANVRILLNQVKVERPKVCGRGRVQAGHAPARRHVAKRFQGAGL
ncbi:MAG: hypothetical protein WDO13_16435 [Verrucomicrobiota bacterium]